MGARGTAAEQLIQQGYEKARVDTLRGAITTTLSVRGVPMSAFGQETLASCANSDTLLGWLARAATASSEVEVFGNDEGRCAASP